MGRMVDHSIYVDPRLAEKIALIKKKIIDDVNKQYATRVRIMFNDLVRVSPQWSGDFASNWRISNNPNSAEYIQTPMKGHTRLDMARRRGDMNSLRSPIARANAVKIDYTSPVFFVNASRTSFNNYGSYPTSSGVTQPYKGANYVAVTKVRGVNLVNGRVAMEAYLRDKYA